VTYTQYKLTDAQLRRLSALVNETRGAATAGMAGKALLAKGLAEGKYWPECATAAGRAALQQARREGW
jgi:hypothetical protein